ncbi:MAG: SHD1 domain-containing protein [Planctomycetota bacterium]
MRLRRMKRGLGAIIGIVYLASAPVWADGESHQADDPGKHVWTDGTGKHQTEAAFVRVNGTDLILRKADGKQITVPLEKLCEADQATAQTMEAVRTDRLAIERVSRQFAQLLRHTKREGADQFITAKAKEVWAANQSPINNIPKVDRGHKARIRGVEIADDEATAIAVLRYKGKSMPATLHLRNEQGDWLIFAATGQNESGDELHYSFEGEGSSQAGNAGSPIPASDGVTAAATMSVGLPRPVSPNRVNPLPKPSVPDQAAAHMASAEDDTES